MTLAPSRVLRLGKFSFSKPNCATNEQKRQEIMCRAMFHDPAAIGAIFALTLDFLGT